MPWQTQHSVNFKNMAFAQSCFPCCLQIALNNLGKIGKNDDIENAWNILQLDAHPETQGLASNAPNAYDIIRNLPQTPSYAPTSSKLITPDMLGPAMTDAKALDLVSGFGNGTYKAMIIGMGHANLIYRQSQTNYVQVNVSPDINALVVQQSAGITVDVLTAVDGNSKVIQVRSAANVNFGLIGDFILLL